MSVLQNVFSREPPVVAKQDSSRRQPRPAQEHGNPPPIPPLPPELGAGRSEPGRRQPQPPISQQAPPPPPKEFNGSRQNQGSIGRPPNPSPPTRLDPQRSNHENWYPQNQQPLSGQVMPRSNSSWNYISTERHSTHQIGRSPYPQPQGPVSPLTPGLEARTQNAYPPDMTNGSQQQFSQQTPASQPLGYAAKPAPQSSYRDVSQQYQNRPAHQQHLPQSYQQQPYSQPPPQLPKTKPPEDLLTSPFENALPTQPVNIAPPPIPPNPQKDALLSALSQTLTQQLQSIHNSNLSALPPLRAQQAAITSTSNAINAEMSQLNDLEALLSTNEAILHKAMRDADKVLEDAKRREVPNVDDVLVAPTLVAGQLYQLVAEESAIEESRGVLGKALDKGRIGGGVWAKVLFKQSWF